ncbi:MAG: hypothetical protein PHE64_07530, partial [Candidatus Cloacimonetes bacterium]|nr:hypothetical protein [Candidatus Cloacimonadota bacterium]MDD4791285.1 hypothetical protein [Candidatus Cloacimonadota bacterium]
REENICCNNSTEYDPHYKPSLKTSQSPKIKCPSPKDDEPYEFLSRFEVKYKYKLWDKTVPDLPGLVIKTMKSVESMTVKPRRGDTYRKCNYGCEA